ncbi:MAG: hypothetical protein AB1758_05640, partial [Candidatus Eremiobacterota bacterium]
PGLVAPATAPDANSAEVRAIFAEMKQDRENHVAQRETLAQSVRQGWTQALDEVRTKGAMMHENASNMWRASFSTMGGGMMGGGMMTPGMPMAPGMTPGMPPGMPMTPGMPMAPGMTPGMPPGMPMTPGMPMAPGMTPGMTPGMPMTPGMMAPGMAPTTATMATPGFTGMSTYPTGLYPTGPGSYTGYSSNGYLFR